VLLREPRAVLVSTCPGFAIRGGESASDAGLVDYRQTMLSAAGEFGYIACMAVRRDALLKMGGFDERLNAGEDSDLWRRLATLGPFARVRRRTVAIQATSGSLRDRAQRTGDYLAAADISARNLVTAVDGMREPERTRLAGEAAGVAHLATAMRALDRGDRPALRAELEAACRLIPLSDSPLLVAHRVRCHFPRFRQRAERLRALEAVAELWPEKHASTARYLRAWAMVLAVRMWRPQVAARLLAGWRIPGTVRFTRKIAPLLRHRARQSLTERRHRAREAQLLRADEEDR
jgi:hypothetical protein